MYLLGIMNFKDVDLIHWTFWVKGGIIFILFTKSYHAHVFELFEISEILSKCLLAILFLAISLFSAI